MTELEDDDELRDNPLWQEISRRRFEGSRRVVRACLMCDRDFMAKGIYNRICKSCTVRNREFFIFNE